MKSYLCLLLIIAIMLFSTTFLYADEGEWEIVLDGFKFADIAHEGDYIWCATLGDGILHYNKTDGSYIQYTTEHGLSSNSVRCVAVDKNGIKWIGVGFEIASYNDATWITFSSATTGLSSGLHEVAIDNNNVKWFSSFSGISSYNDTTFVYHRKGIVSGIYVDNNNIWFAEGSRRIKYDGKEWMIYPEAESMFEYGSVVIDYNNRQVWGGCGLRIFYDEEIITYFELFGYELLVSAITLDSHNTKWIGTDRSLIRYDDIEFKQAIEFKGYDTIYYHISAIEIDDDGTVWFVAEAGSSKKGILAKYTPEDTTTHVETKPLPEEITLHQAHPNPFNPATTISYEIPFDAQVRLVVYDILGRKISVLQDGMMSAGLHSVVWNGRDSNGEPAGSGVYIYQLVAGEHTAQGKMLLMR